MGNTLSALLAAGFAAAGFAGQGLGGVQASSPRADFGFGGTGARTPFASVWHEGAPATSARLRPVACATAAAGDSSACFAAAARRP